MPGSNSSENKTNAEISLLYDVISHYVIDAQIGSIAVSEREYAMKNLVCFSSVCDEKDIIIFDRGYPSKDIDRCDVRHGLQISDAASGFVLQRR